MVTKPPRFAETGVFGTLPWADTVVFTWVRVTRMFLAPFRRSEARHFHVGFQGFTQPFLEVERDRAYKLRMKIVSKKKIIRGWKKKGGVVIGWLWTHRKFEVLNNGKYLGTTKSSYSALFCWTISKWSVTASAQFSYRSRVYIRKPWEKKRH